jgi:hypothetical protein
MNEQDKEHLEAVYAGLAMVGFLINGDYSIEEIPSRSKAMAKSMMQEEEAGIVAIKLKRNRKAV